MRHFPLMLLLVTLLGCGQSETETSAEHEHEAGEHGEHEAGEHEAGEHEAGEHEAGDEHTATGEIKAIDDTRIDIAHEDIPGFMPAMQMPFFTNADSTVPDGLAVGDRIEFTFAPQEGGRMVIRTVRTL